VRSGEERLILPKAAPSGQNVLFSHAVHDACPVRPFVELPEGHSEHGRILD